MTGDSFFGAPYIDVDEHRDDPRPHRYVHGGFTDTDTRFSFYFPPAEQYGGRFFQFLEGGHGGSEHALTQRVRGGDPADSFDLAFTELRGYLIESNQGHIGNDLSGLHGDWSITYWRASAASARYASELAAAMYGTPPRYGYVYGPSGGGLRTMWCMENAGDLYQGGVPYVISTMVSLTLSAHAYGVEGLGDALASVIDATDVGGSGDPFAGLTSIQREALAVLYRTGWARRAEAQLRREMIFGFPMQTMWKDDPSYFDDFWTVPGYAGADGSGDLEKRLREGKAVVKRTLLANEIDDPLAAYLARSPDACLGVELDVDDPQSLFYAKLTFTSGRAAGRELYVGMIAGDVLIPYAVGSPELFNGVEPGDEVEFDNRDYVAFCYYHRHHPSFPENHQFTVDGHGIYPQRGQWVDPFTGRFDGKMILCPSSLDSNVFPPTTYPRLVSEYHRDRADDHFRLWFMDNATHGSPVFHRPGKVWETRLIDYRGIIDQALRDLVEWVERDTAPAMLNYSFTDDNALVLPPSADQRGGIQPVVTATADGGSRADIRVGTTVTLRGTATAPAGAGTIVRAEWDFDGSATWPVSCPEADGRDAAIDVTVSHTFAEPGTYFPSFRAAAHRHGNEGRGEPVWNLARVRVVVHDNDGIGAK